MFLGKMEDKLMPWDGGGSTSKMHLGGKEMRLTVSSGPQSPAGSKTAVLQNARTWEFNPVLDRWNPYPAPRAPISLAPTANRSHDPS